MTKKNSLLLLACALVMGAIGLTSPAVANTSNSQHPNIEALLAEQEPHAEAAITMPSWFKDGRPSSDVATALNVLADAQSQGLRPQDYRADELVAIFSQPENQAITPERQQQLDTELTTAVERYLQHLVQGRLSPQDLKHRFKAPAHTAFDAHDYLARARQDNRLAQALQEAQPRVPMYAAIKQAMVAYRAMGNHPAWDQPLPALPGNALRPEMPYSGLDVLVDRLVALGDLSPPAVRNEIYSDELIEGVRHFQERHGLEVDGVIGPATLEQLNITPAQRVEQMALTLERLRWTPLLHAPRMIVVNVPEFILRAYEQHEGRVKMNLEMRVIVGKALNTRTPIFLEDMRYIEFSPYWNVPASIARGETLPRLRRDPAYFNRAGYEFVTPSGEVIRQLSDDGISAVQRGEWRIRQRPGPANAMGSIKFIFPNDQNIYLHYTASPQLFTRARRDFSHGCIRVEAPVALAEFVLRTQPEWTSERIERAMNSGRSSTLRLDQTLPVLIAYSTVVVKDNGKVYFFADIYQQDKLLAEALKKVRPV